MSINIHDCMFAYYDDRCMTPQTQQVERSPYINAHKLCINLEYALDEQGNFKKKY